MSQEIPQDIIDDLSAAFERDPWINLHKYPLEASPENGRLLLEGKAENIATKRRARALAQQIVRDRWPIDDQVRRAADQPMGDLELRDDIIKRLESESSFRDYTIRTEVGEKTDTIHDAGPDACEIVIRIQDAAVTLTGTVGSLSHQRLIEALIWWSYGCELVDNQLQVVPPEEDNDNEITDAVLIVLEKDPLVHETQLRVGTAGAIVHLDGYVGNDEEKKYAALDAWSVPGVWDVVDRIEVQ